MELQAALALQATVELEAAHSLVAALELAAPQSLEAATAPEVGVFCSCQRAAPPAGG